MTEMIYCGPSRTSPSCTEVEFWENINEHRYSCLTDMFTMELNDGELLKQRMIYYHELFTGPEQIFYQDPET
jgi:hypothetical protein